jgi:hypothetical protein
LQSEPSRFEPVRRETGDVTRRIGVGYRLS